MYTNRQNLGLPCVYVSWVMIHFTKSYININITLERSSKKKLQTRQSGLNVRAP